jgi:hypothetical protein
MSKEMKVKGRKKQSKLYFSLSPSVSWQEEELCARHKTAACAVLPI